MFHLMANGVATGGAVTLLDMPAATDTEFSQRNSHYIFSEDYNILAAMTTGATVTRVQSNIPHINYINPHLIYPVNPAVTIPTNVQVDDYRSYPFRLPQNEEIAWQVSDSASEQANLFTWIGTPDWNMNLPRGIQRLTMLATASVVCTANAWSLPVTITITNTVRGGVYAILGAECVAAATLAFRINFPRRRLYMGRKTHPGSMATQTFGLIPNRLGRNWLGEWGRFHTFELPQIEAWANASATVTHTLYLDVAYLGEDMSLLQAA